METIKYHTEIIQGSEEWHEIKKGKMSASNASVIRVAGKGLITYCKKVGSSVVSMLEEQKINSDMQRGNELEPYARMLYELQKNTKVVEVGFVENSKYKKTGCSPDGLVGEDGGIEIKARNNEKHYSLIIGEEDEIPYDQIQMTLLITERKWWDFISYNPNFKEVPIFIKRIYPDPTIFEKLKKGLAKGLDLINENHSKYENYKKSIT